MDSDEERQINQEAYRRLKATIATSYPHGQYVAIDRGEIVGDSASFSELHQALQAKGRTSRRILVVEAGVDYLEYFEFLGIRL